MSENIENIKNLLNGFLTEMYEWEDNANQHIDAGTDIPSEILKQTLKVIYDKYLTDKPRKRGRLESMSVIYPPKFNPNNETIVEIEEKRNSIAVKCNVLYANLEMQRIYTFKKQAGVWKLDNAKEFDDYDNKWHSIHI